MQRGKFQIMPDLTQEEFNALKDDIKANGVRVPVEYDEEGNVLDGHHRVIACHELGITDFPCRVNAGLTDDEKVEFALRLNMNRRHLSSKQKREIIAVELKRDPKRSDNIIASIVGVSHPTVSAVRKEMEKAGQVVKFTTIVGKDGVKQRRKKRKASSNFQTTAHGRKKTIRQLGEIAQAAEKEPEKYRDLMEQVEETGNVHTAHFELERRKRREETQMKAAGVNVSLEHRVIHADNMRMIEDGSVDLVLTDPPYNISRDRTVDLPNRLPYRNDFGEWDRTDQENYLQRYFYWSQEFYRVLREGGSAYVFCAEIYVSYIRNIMEYAGFGIKNCIVWRFPNPKPKSDKTSWITCTDHAVFAVKGSGHTFHWDGVNQMHNVIEYPKAQGKERRDHPTQKPLKLFERLISVSSDPGDVVLDAFAGTGTTGEACQDLGRRFILIERELDYIHIIEDRTGVKHERGDFIYEENH